MGYFLLFDGGGGGGGGVFTSPFFIFENNKKVNFLEEKKLHGKFHKLQRDVYGLGVP